jgi:abortive infection bacteriophage resistance protein
MPTPFSLTALSPAEQVINLASKGVIFEGNEKQEAERFFIRYSHFKVNYHWQDFQQKNGDKYVYLPHTKWSTLQKRYVLEWDLKQCYFVYITLIEATFKNTLCFYSCNKLGNDWWSHPKYINNAKTQTFITPILTFCNDYKN